MRKLFTVEELACEARVTPRTVRLYVERGILNPLRAGRTLCFTHEDAATLFDVLRAKRLGFSLGEIKRHLEAPTNARIQARLKRVRQVKDDAETELAHLNRRLKDRS